MNEFLRQLPRARKLLFAGSGISTHLGIPSWTELWREVGQSLSKRDRATLATRLGAPSPDLYSVADELVACLGRDQVEGTAVSIIGSRQARILSDASISGWTGLLKKLNVSGVVTTNWDTLLSELSGFPALIWPQDADAFWRALQDNTPFVLYLHGNVESRPLVMTRSDCERVAKTMASDDRHGDLSSAISIHYVVVIGCGFPDDHLRHVFSLAGKCAGRSGQVIVVLRQDEFSERGDFDWMPDTPTTIRFHSYDDFHEALVQLAAYCDPSSSLVLVPTVTTVEDFREIVVGQPYDFETASAMRHAYREAANVQTLLELTAQFVAESPPSDHQAQGLAATMLSTLADRWNPASTLIAKLEEMCQDAIRQGDTDQIGVVEPLAFAVARKGLTSAHAHHLRALVVNRDWRSADVARSWDYYGRSDTQINAIQRHVRDPFRTGVLKANDITRLLGLLSSEPESVRPSLEDLVRTSLQVLKQGGEDSLVERVIADIARVRRSRAA
jgi:hypothetical protein